ncbi:hypothetical protein FA13DRAFT_893220 [Coprinellus micaceus]|uniref:Uncharacterized protein n=1 Tax=Coprinellus micaceus TaxID=71717 RepID=A0A4Y7TUH4_COPMI|nr:hypothetical protein FA13DRAFT_893220 [Coprinellus micaceus]
MGGDCLGIEEARGAKSEKTIEMVVRNKKRTFNNSCRARRARSWRCIIDNLNSMPQFGVSRCFADSTQHARGCRRIVSERKLTPNSHDARKSKRPTFPSNNLADVNPWNRRTPESSPPLSYLPRARTSGLVEESHGIWMSSKVWRFIVAGSMVPLKEWNEKQKNDA